MPLFEHMPYTNYENVNLDWIVKTVKAHDTDITQLKEDVTNIQNTISAIEGSITNIETNITQIFEQLGDIDVDDLEARITALEEYDQTLHGMINNLLSRVIGDEEDIATNTTNISTNDLASQNRDNALSARISALERAHLHDIYNYYAEGNQCIFGSDLRKLPTSCKTSDGYPAGWGNKTNRADGQTQARSFRFTDDGMVANTVDSNVGYDYFQVGRYSSGLFNGSAYTVTFAVSTGGDATPAWYTHTFSAFGEQWEVATGCIIKARNFYAWSGADDFYKTISFMGTPANWNTFLNGKKIVFIYVENGTGSVDTAATAKCEFDVKDRIFFEEAPEPTVDQNWTVITIGKNSFDLPAYYIDEVGDQVNYYLPVLRMSGSICVDPSCHMFQGFIVLRVRDTSHATSATQLDGLTEKGCFVDALIEGVTSLNSLSGNVYNTYDTSNYDLLKNVYTGGSLVANGSSNTPKIHVKIETSGFAINQATGIEQLQAIPIWGYKV